MPENPNNPIGRYAMMPRGEAWQVLQDHARGYGFDNATDTIIHMWQLIQNNYVPPPPPPTLASGAGEHSIVLQARTARDVEVLLQTPDYQFVDVSALIDWLIAGAKIRHPLIRLALDRAEYNRRQNP